MGFETNAEMFNSVKKPDEQKAVLKAAPVQAVLEAIIPEVTLKLEGLPSRGTTYPKGATIKYRSYSFGEVKKTNQEKLSEKESIELMLSGVTCSFDKLDITLSDAIFIGLLRKISTLGSTKVIIPFACSSCKSQEKPVLDTQNLEFDDIKAPKLPVKADLKAGEFIFTPITVKRFFWLFDNGKKHKDEIACAAVQVENRKFQETYDYLYNMDIEDGSVVNEVDELLYHGLKSVKLACSKCSTVHEIELDGGQALLIPFREHEFAPKSRIHFGNET